MKVQSWWMLLATTFFAGCLIDNLKSFMSGDKFYYFKVVICVCLVIKGLYVSFSKGAWEEVQRKRKATKKAYQKRFGKFAPIAPFVALTIIILGYGIDVLFERTWIFMVIIFLGLIYVVWLALTMPKHIRAELNEENIDEENECK